MRAGAVNSAADVSTDGSVDELLGALTDEEKVRLLSGSDGFRLAAIDRLRIPPLLVSDGPSGVRGESFTNGVSACFPCPTALGASWDPDLVRTVGIALGVEARRMGVSVLLAPTLNLLRSPLGGRNFEFFSEDPELCGQTGRAFVEGVQSTGVACCVKHLVGNDTEIERRTISADIDEDVLRELYLHPFEEAIRAGARCVMTSYNRLGGTYTSESAWLLEEVLRQDWGFSGVTMSDWFSTHSTAPALAAGLDLEMPGPSRLRGGRLLDAWRRGEVAVGQIDRAVRRVLTLILESAVPCDGEPSPPLEPDNQALIREAGARASVLLKNEGALPLVPSDLDAVALIGPGADHGEAQAGGSSRVSPERFSPILPAITDALEPGVAVRFARGCVLADSPRRLAAPLVRTPAGEPGVLLEYLTRDDPAAPALRSEVTAAPAGTWVHTPVPGMAPESSLVRASCFVRGFEDGLHRLTAAGTGSIRLWIDGELLIEHEATIPSSEAWEINRQAVSAAVELGVVRERQLVIEFGSSAEQELISFEVGIVPPDPGDLLARAVTVASEVDVAVVVVGSPPGAEAEGHDRSSLELPGPQDELVKRVASAAARTVVIVNSAAPYAMPWVDEVDAVLQLWFPGQQVGESLADLLTGRINPCGRLPMTLFKRAADAPSAPFYPGRHSRMPYGERFSVGYRRMQGERRSPPHFPFGHGLSYASFKIGEPELSIGRGRDGSYYELTVPVRHEVGPAGREVVQAYVATGSPDRPILELKGFAAVTVRAGEEKKAVIRLPERRLRVWSAEGWRRPDGPIWVRIGTSSTALPFELELPPLGSSATSQENDSNARR